MLQRQCWPATRKHGLCRSKRMGIEWTEMVDSLDTTLPFLSDSYLYDNGQLFGDSSAYYVWLHLKVSMCKFHLWKSDRAKTRPAWLLATVMTLHCKNGGRSPGWFSREEGRGPQLSEVLSSRRAGGMFSNYSELQPLYKHFKKEPLPLPPPLPPSHTHTQTHTFSTHPIWCHSHLKSPVSNQTGWWEGWIVSFCNHLVLAPSLPGITQMVRQLSSRTSLVCIS